MSVPLPSREASLYESFYGLVQSPFALAPDPRFLYLSESHDSAIRRILQALRRREGFIVLSGEIGTGKTTLCRALLEQLDQTAFSCLILNPFVTVEELLRQVLIDYGVVSRDGLRSERFTAATRRELVDALSDFLLTLAPLKGSAVVIIDEAQHLAPAVLEELRIIAGMHSHDARLLQIVLVGQPGLLEVVSAADMRQLDQRISLKAMLQPLTREDVDQYVTHRLTVAGESVSVVFERAALKRLHALSGGVPRVINLLCDRALMAGAERGLHEIGPAMIDEAADAVSFRRPPAEVDRPHRRTRLPAWGVVMIIVLGLLAMVPLVTPLHRFVQTSAPQLPAPPPADIPAIALPAIPPDEPTPLEILAPGETPSTYVAPRRAAPPPAAPLLEPADRQP